MAQSTSGTGKGGSVISSPHYFESLMMKKSFTTTLFVLLCGNPVAALELNTLEPDATEQKPYVNIQNLSHSARAFALSSGSQFELQENTGKLLPCADISGVMLFVESSQNEVSSLSQGLECGYTYIL